MVPDGLYEKQHDTGDSTQRGKDGEKGVGVREGRGTGIKGEKAWKFKLKTEGVKEEEREQK